MRLCVALGITILRRKCGLACSPSLEQQMLKRQHNCHYNDDSGCDDCRWLAKRHVK